LAGLFDGLLGLGEEFFRFPNGFCGFPKSLELNLFQNMRAGFCRFHSKEILIPAELPRNMFASPKTNEQKLYRPGMLIRFRIKESTNEAFLTNPVKTSTSQPGVTKLLENMVARDGVEPPTPAFSDYPY